MNIIVRPYGSNLSYCRPDTTWERENKDFYSPECVNEIYWTPVIFARISKAGKCVGSKFAGRYYDAAGCGMLMHCATPGMSEIVDRSSILPLPMFNPVVLEDEKVFTINGRDVILSGAKNLLEESLCQVSELTSLRIGDIVAVGLAEPEILARREDGEAEVKGTFCEKEIFEFKIIF